MLRPVPYKRNNNNFNRTFFTKQTARGWWYEEGIM